MNIWLDFTEQILRKVHWTCTCAQSQGPNLRGGAKYAKYAGDGRWAWCKTKYAKQLFVNTLPAGYWLIRRKKKTSCCQFGLTIMCVFYIFIEFKLLSHYWHICCMIIFGRDWNIWRNMYFEQQIRSDLHQFTFLGSTLKALLNGNFLNQFYRSLDIKLEYSWRPWNVYSCLEFMHFDSEVST